MLLVVSAFPVAFPNPKPIRFFFFFSKLIFIQTFLNDWLEHVHIEKKQASSSARLWGLLCLASAPGGWLHNPSICTDDGPAPGESRPQMKKYASMCKQLQNASELHLFSLRLVSLKIQVCYLRCAFGKEVSKPDMAIAKNDPVLWGILLW